MSICLCGLKDTRNSSLKEYNDLFITHNIWKETMQTMDKDEIFYCYQTDYAFSCMNTLRVRIKTEAYFGL